MLAQCNGRALVQAGVCDNATMKPLIILSHGLHSGPDATKVSALAAIAAPLGFDCVRPDYRDLDASHDVKRIDDRIARLVAQVSPGRPVILAGSSMGAFISAHASLQVSCIGLFLIALPVTIPAYDRHFDAARVPTTLLHGWDDDLCPVEDAMAFARARGDAVILVRDDHRLSAHVDFVGQQFALFLEQFG